MQAWEGMRSVAEWRPRCVQSSRLGDLDPLNKRMDEDCLYLNMFTPAKSADEKLPVMVWIHGGSTLKRTPKRHDRCRHRGQQGAAARSSDRATRAPDQVAAWLRRRL